MASNRPRTSQAQPEPRASISGAPRRSLGEGVVLIDPDRRLIVLSPAAKQMLGLSQDAPFQQPFEALPAPLAKVSIEAALAEKPLRSQVLELPMDGESRRVEVMPLQIEVAQGQSRIMLVLNEENSLTHLEEHVERLNRLAGLGTLAASMAHEIKNALVAGKTFIDLLLESNRDAELAQVVQREIARIDSMVTRMLRFARPGDSKFRDVHLHEVLEHSIRLVDPLMETKSIACTRSFGAPTDLIQADEHELQQAFVNLLLNAADAVGSNGKVSVATMVASTARADESAIQITIQDTGVGISPQNLRHLFEPFFTTKPSGTGLGLAITRRILQQHGGDIQVESQPGTGTIFTMVLPFAPHSSS